MTRFLVIATVIALALTVFALVDVIFSDRDRVRGVPKGLWFFVVIVVPLVGAVLWWTVGRPRKDSPAAMGKRPLAPDDDPDFLRGLGDRPGGTPGE